LVTDSTLNAFTTGSEIVIHSSLLRIARSDAQLGMIVGHELAHANLGHLDKQRANQALGWTSGAVIDVGILLGTRISTGLTFAREFARAGQRAYSVAFEREADYVGAYYAARAGYDLTGAEEFWRSYSLESPDSISPRNHASGDARAVRADTKSCCGDCRQAAAQQTANSGATSHRCRD